MHAVDFNGDMNDYVLDESRKISKAHLYAVCKMRQGEQTCKYVGLGPSGYFCAKKTPIKVTLDYKAENKQMIARGDNCEGLGKLQNPDKK